MKTKLLLLGMVLCAQTCLSQAVDTINVDNVATNSPNFVYCINDTNRVILKTINHTGINTWILVGPDSTNMNHVTITAANQGHCTFTASGFTVDFFIWFDASPYQPTSVHNYTMCTTNFSLALHGQNNPSGHPAQLQWKFNGTLVGTSELYTATQYGHYTLTVKDSCGTATYSMNISYANPDHVDLGPDQIICYLSTTTLDATTNNALTYAWSNGATSPTLVVDTTGTYAVTVTNSNGCNSRDTIQVTATIPIKPTIKVVTANMNHLSPNFGLNIVKWDSLLTSGSFIKTYRLIGANWTFMGITPKINGYYQDNISSAAFAQYYKISSVDSCGNESSMSGYFKSLKCWGVRTINNDVQVEWESVDIETSSKEAYSVQQYDIYRFANGIPIWIGTTGSGNTTFTDYNATLNDTGYAASAVVASSKTLFNAFSNPAYVDTTTGIEELNAENAINVFPNPTPNYITVTGIEEFTAIVYDSDGNQLLMQKNQCIVNLDSFCPGTYFVAIASKKVNEVKKVIKE